MANALVKPAVKLANIEKALLDREQLIRQLLGYSRITAPRLMALARTSITKTPKLLECAPHHLLGAIYECAKLGLPPDTPAALCHLVPFNKKTKGGGWETVCQVILGFRGMVLLARRALGAEMSLYTDAVRARDVFDHAGGDEPSIRHSRPWGVDKDDNPYPLSEEERGPLVAAYAVAKLGDSVWRRVVYRDEVMRAKASSRTKYGPWHDQNEPAMWEKTAIRRLCKVLPLPDDQRGELMNRAVQLDDAHDDGVDQGLGEDWLALDEKSIAVEVVQGEASNARE